MNNIEKEFVPYELALRMKAIGFDEPCFAFYNGKHLDLGVWDWEYPAGEKRRDIGECPQAPTFSQAFRFFREKYQMFPEVLTDCTTEPKFVYTYNTFYGNPKDLTEQEWSWGNNIGQYSDMYRTYEEAELAALDKLIEMIEKKIK